MPETHLELVERICRLIDHHSAEPLTLADLGEAAGVSPAHLQRVFKRLMGISPRQYADARRLGQFKARLKEKRTVTTALYEAGYGSASRIYERAAGQLGMTPGAYRAGGQSVTIRYTLVDCPLGRLLLAGTEKGVSAVYLGDADGPLADELKREFPAAALARDDEALAEWAGQVRRHLQGGLVWQAEEVREGNRWHRYYGFVGRHVVAQVPAEEIDFVASCEGNHKRVLR